jgi:hypothetical protein
MTYAAIHIPFTVLHRCEQQSNDTPTRRLLLVHDARMPTWQNVTIEVVATPAETIAALQSVSDVGERAYVEIWGANSVTIEDLWRPRWVYTLCVALFPIGLPAALYRQHTRLEVSVTYGHNGGSVITLNGNASRRVDGATWRVLSDLLGDNAGPIRAASRTRLPELRRAAHKWARANPWHFSIGLGVVVLFLSWSPHWGSWSSAAGAAVATLLLTGLAARALGLWPNNRVIHWRTARDYQRRAGQQPR